jgi:hypothetical protein
MMNWLYLIDSVVTVNVGEPAPQEYVQVSRPLFDSGDETFSISPDGRCLLAIERSDGATIDCKPARQLPRELNCAYATDATVKHFLDWWLTGQLGTLQDALVTCVVALAGQKAGLVEERVIAMQSGELRFSAD